MKTKNLSQRIEERLSKDKTNQRALNKAAILALKNEIYNAANDGWSYHQIWLTLHDEGSIKVTYQTFLNQVKKYVNTVKIVNTEKPDAGTKEGTEEQKINQERGNNRNISKSPIKEFKFNATPNKEDLL